MPMRIYNTLFILLTLMAAVTSADPLEPITAEEWTPRHAAHLLERAGFGGTPEEVARLAAMTPEQAVDSLVNYESISDADLPAFEHSGIYPNGYKLARLEDVVLTALITKKAFGVKAEQPGPLKYQPAIDEFYTLLVSEYIEMMRVGQWWADRMVRTPRPLEERMTLFWHDHFATSQEKVFNYELLLAQNATFREHATGDFRDLLIAVAQDPAMLVWLDNRFNIKGSPNENFAREVMELFTMGEGHGYTESDIRELARAFTGWTAKPIRTIRDDGGFIDDPKKHDAGDKTILGQTAAFDGYEAIDLILAQPATPKYVTAKLYRFHVREDMDVDVNMRLAELLVENDWELKPVLRTLFLSRDFYSDASMGTRIKPPVEFLVSTYRKLGVDHIPGAPDFTETSRNLGQALFFPPNVAGWPEGKSWINPATLLARGNFVHGLLFPDARARFPVDKTIPPGFREIPMAFGAYGVEPHIWDPQAGRMRPVSMLEYKEYLATIDGHGGSGPQVDDGGELRGEGQDAGKGPDGDGGAYGKMGGDTMMMSGGGREKPAMGDSQLSKIANSEDFNLAVGVYRGFVEALNRLTPLERDEAVIDCIAMLRSDPAIGESASVEDAVDALCRRFLSIELHPERRAAIVDYLREAIGEDDIAWESPKLDEALRRTVHLILSAPEYQVG